MDLIKIQIRYEMTFLQKGCSGESPKRETGPSNNEAEL